MMEKFANDMEKVAYYVGRARAYRSIGFPEEQIKLAFVNDGFSPEIADALVKEATGWGSLIGKGLRWGAQQLGRGAGALRRNVRGAEAARGFVDLGSKAPLGERAMGFGAKQLGRAAGGLQAASRGMTAAPLQTLGRGAIETGKGALFMGGKGIGGTLGKGMFGASMIGMARGGGQPQMPQAYGGSMMRYPQQGY